MFCTVAIIITVDLATVLYPGLEITIQPSQSSKTLISNHQVDAYNYSEM